MAHSRLRFLTHITRALLRANPSTQFVFGDNLCRRGLGDQAAQMRGEPNAVGLPTKREPTTHPRAYLCDADLALVEAAAAPDIARLKRHLEAGRDVVWPSAGIGTGRADLARRAPAIARWYASVLDELKRIVTLTEAPAQQVERLMGTGVPGLDAFTPCPRCSDAIWHLREGLHLIQALAVDYDGKRTADDLKGLLDGIPDICRRTLHGKALYQRSPHSPPPARTSIQPDQASTHKENHP
jgi:hypothetical protein